MKGDLLKLTTRHEVYCIERSKGVIQRKAYVAAGFSEAGAKQSAHRLEKDPLIKARIKEHIDARFKALHMDADEILARIAMLARADVRALFDENGRLRKPTDLSMEEAAGVAGIETVETLQGEGKDAELVAIRKVRLRDPMPALRLLAEYKKLVKSPEEGINALAGAIADRLKAARERERKRKEPKP